MSVPSWAHFLVSEDRHRAFVDAVERELVARAVAFELQHQGGSAQVQADHGAGRERQVTLGLQSLAQRWHGLGEEAVGPVGDALVSAHFDGVWHAVQAPDPALEARLDDLDEARPMLRLRLFNERAAVALAVGLVQRRLARGLFAALAFDLPRSVRSVEPEHLERWGCTLDALWDEALANTLATPVVVEDLRVFDRLPCLALTGDTLFTTSHVLGLGELFGGRPASVPELGALVVVPNRHTLLVHALGVHQTEVATALSVMSSAAAKLYEQGPGSLSPELYWWRDGGLTHLRASKDSEGRLVLGAPEAFMREVVGEAGS